MKIPAFIATAAKAWVAGISAIVAASLPQIAEETNKLLLTLLTTALAATTTWLVRNRPLE